MGASACLYGARSTRSGSRAKYAAWPKGAGFVEPRTVRFEAPGANGAVIARKP